MTAQGISITTPMFIVGHYDNVSFGVFRKFDLAALKALDDNHMAVHDRHPKVCTLVVAQGSFELPSSDVRGESAKLMRMRAHTQLCSVTAIPGGGFVSAAARAVLTAIQVLSSHAYPLHCTNSIEEAARWTAQQAKRDVMWTSGLTQTVQAAALKINFQ